MNIKKFVKKYNLHDSLLESIKFNEKEKKVKLTIDYCYWQQEDYQDGQQEMGVIYVLFSGVKSISYDDYTINSDSIISCEVNEDEKLIMEVENDITNDCHTVSICAKNVEIIKDL